MCYTQKQNTHTHTHTHTFTKLSVGSSGAGMQRGRLCYANPPSESFEILDVI